MKDRYKHGLFFTSIILILIILFGIFNYYYEAQEIELDLKHVKTITYYSGGMFQGCIVANLPLNKLPLNFDIGLLKGNEFHSHYIGLNLEKNDALNYDYTSSNSFHFKIVFTDQEPLEIDSRFYSIKEIIQEENNKTKYSGCFIAPKKGFITFIFEADPADPEITIRVTFNAGI